MHPPNHPDEPSATLCSDLPVRIRPAEEGDHSRWNEFLEGSPDANFYQRFEWREANHELLRLDTRFLIAERGETVVGVFPLVHVRSRLFGNIISSMPFVNFGGIAARDSEAERSLLQEACQYADECRCDYLEIRTDRHLPPLLAVSNKVSMTVDLDPDPEAVMAAFSRKHRKNIRWTFRQGIHVRSGGVELLDPFYRLMTLSWRDLGTPLYGKPYFRGLMSRFGEDVRIFLAFKGDVPLATAMNGYFRDTAEGMWAGADPSYRELQPNYALLWDMIEDACRRGFQHFHLGRSTVDSGAAHFKAKWNGRPERLHWNYHLVRRTDLPALNPDNPKFALAIRAWRRLPLAVTRFVGPPLARLLP